MERHGKSGFAIEYESDEVIKIPANLVKNMHLQEGRALFVVDDIGGISLENDFSLVMANFYRQIDEVTSKDSSFSNLSEEEIVQRIKEERRSKFEKVREDCEFVFGEMLNEGDC